MKTSKYLAFGLSALLALSLASCGGQQAQEPQEPQEPKQEVQQAGPITTQPVVATEEVKQEVVTVAPETVPEEGQTAQDGDVSSEADTPEEIDPAVELFEAVEGGEQTVYATGTVNIRASWSADSEKLGTLSKGEEVERVGIGKEGSEAEGWSQVRISDGQAEDGEEQFRIVYVSNKYLSTTKPQPQQTQTQSKTSTSKPATSKPSTSTQTQASKPAEKPVETQQSTSGGLELDEECLEFNAMFFHPRKQSADLAPSGQPWADMTCDNHLLSEEEMDEMNRLWAAERGVVQD